MSNLFGLMIFISFIKLSINSCMYFEIGNGNYKYYTSCISLQHFKVGFSVCITGYSSLMLLSYKSLLHSLCCMFIYYVVEMLNKIQ